MKKIGILALQGDFALHGDALNQLEVQHQFIKKPEQLDDLDGLIIPGGESSTLLKLMQPWQWDIAIKDFHTAKKGIFGTCAGCILLAKQVTPEQTSLGLIDITVSRNAYGRQVDSFVTTSQTQFAEQLLEMVFIRAPKITAVEATVDILAEHQHEAVLAQQDNVLVATFHPEMSAPYTVHQYFIDHCCS